MADSVNVPIVTTGWTEVQQGTAGSISNESDFDIIVREAAADPTSTVTTGHDVRPRGNATYKLGAGQKVFARAILQNSTVVVTEA